MKGPRSGTGARRRLGVLGTLVLDSVVRPGRPPATGLWGGVAYSLAAFDHVLGPDWRLVPLIALGADVAEAGRRCLARLSPSADLSRLRARSGRNNRVELRLAPDGSRTERLSGGMPGWTAGEIAGELAGLDALYVNFVSGTEASLAGARRVRDDFGGPAYADLHSLFLSVESDGARVPRLVAEAPDVAACFDYVQMNEEEFALFRRSSEGASAAPAGRTKLLAVTLGPEGADLRAAGAVAKRVTGEPGPPDADPVGCGDVWGAAFFARLLGGAAPRRAAAEAHAVAACNLACSGALALKARLAAAGPEPPAASSSPSRGGP